MKAVVYNKPYDLSLTDVPEPRIKDGRDIIVRVTSTAICGSDLHIYHGLYPHVPKGTVLGHEFMGIVEETGPDIEKWKPGDRVIVPFPIACGECKMCKAGLWSHCHVTNDRAKQGAYFGHGEAYGGVPGGQAEYARVPYADVSPIAVPEDMQDEQVLFLTDILPTAYWIVDVSGVKPGDTVAVFGCGPVGLLVQRCAKFKGADRIIAVDQVPYRLEFAEKINPGIEVINFRETEKPGEEIQRLTDNDGVDVAIDAVGLEGEPTSKLIAPLAWASQHGIPSPPGLRPEDQPPVSSVSVIQMCVESVRHGGTIGLAGTYGAKVNGFPIGDIFGKGLTIKAGQALVQNYTEELLGYIREGKLRADDIITHHLPLEAALDGYSKFSRREDNCIKVVLHPHNN